MVDWKRAFRLMVKEKVEVISYSDRCIHNVHGSSLQIPSVMRLIKLIRSVYKSRVPFSKRNILIRDGSRCVYCGERSGKMTIDHIIPLSRGGRSDFENCVTACRRCNQRKGNRTPSEARMYMKSRPYQPTISEFFRLRLKRMGIHDLWQHIGMIS